MAKTSPAADRAPYRDVGAAVRQAIGRAVGPEFTDGERRTLLAVISLVASWSRLDDRVYVADVADAARLSDRHTRDCLAKLAALGVVVWEPRRGRNVKSRLGLLPDSKSGTDGPPVIEHEASDPTAGIQSLKSVKPELADEKTGTGTPENRKCRSAEDREETPSRNSEKV